MSDLVEFLRARFDEDEKAALAATPGPWGYNPGKVWLGAEAFESFDRSQGEEYVSHGGPSPFTGCVAATGPADHPQSMADAVHIARHDPARVLADVAVKREILRLHGRMAIEPTHPQFNDAHLTKESMVICRSCEPETMWRRARSWPCRTLWALAVPYAGHVDYRQEWAPEAV